ncbi:MAG TPA: class I SAM-dependent methyltransferase, partial [Gemmatimonadaceae bacterium]|nr:class I SAM-dependent methyltransferase [Gemmatimonadaceae bacterium]
LVAEFAAGPGRHAIAMARAGLRVVALDFSEVALRHARRHAGALPVHCVAADVLALPLREGACDAIVCVNFLDRSLFPTLHRWLRPGGRLILETYTVDQLTLPHGPRNRAHLLARGELPGLVGPLRIEAARETLARDAAGERYVGSVMAVNAGSP